MLFKKKFRESDLKKRPTKSEFLRYKLAGTEISFSISGDTIPLGKLTSHYR